MQVSFFPGEEKNERGNWSHNWVRNQGERCLVTLREPILAKDCKEYKHILGNVWVGLLVNYWNEELVNGLGAHIQFGNGENPNRLAVPLSSVVSIQVCSKVLNDERILIIEDE